MLVFNKSKKRDAVAFVDYEHWFYGYSNKFQMEPNIKEWVGELKNEFRLRNLYIFADFSEPNIESEMDRLKKLTPNLIHTASEKNGVDKDFTDVIILDQIYRTAAKKNSPDVFILFTGDAHFFKAVQYLKELGKKVIIYGVKFAFSNTLKSEATSYVEMPRQSQEKDFYNNLIFISLNRLKNKPKNAVTYWKTINNVSNYNKVPKERIKHALDNLMRQKYIVRDEKMDKRGKPIDVLVVDWNRIERDGVWNE